MRTMIITTVGIAALTTLPLQAMQIRPAPVAPRAVHATDLVELAHAAQERALVAQEGAISRLELIHSRSAVHAMHDRTGLELLHSSIHAIEPLHLSALESLHALTAVESLPGHAAIATVPPAGWAQEDPADSLWRAAREAVNDGNHSRAATLYRRIRTEPRYVRSTYRPAAYYWEAFVRDRIGTTTERRAALALLSDLRRAYPSYENMSLVGTLESSINASLGAAGDARAAARTQESAARATAQCPDQETQGMAVEALMHMPPENALPILQRVMGRRDDCSAPLRERATHLLSRIRTTEAENLLIQAAKSDPSPKVRQQAIFWLSNVDSDRALEAIESVLRGNSDRAMLEQAAHALSRHRSPRAAQLLREIATRADAPKEARMAALHWLGSRSDAEAAGFLRNLYGSLNDEGLKDAALFALSRQKGVGNEEFLVSIVTNEREPMSARTTALHWAGQSGALTVARLGQLYSGTSTREMKEQIIFALSRRKESEALDRLIDIAKNESNLELRKNAIFWIGRSSDPRAARFIADLIG